MFEKGEPSPEEELPGRTDIVRIDGRWAQVKGGGELLTFLDTNETLPIDWQKYELITRIDLSLGLAMQLSDETPTEEELENLYSRGGHLREI